MKLDKLPEDFPYSLEICKQHYSKSREYLYIDKTIILGFDFIYSHNIQT